MRNLLPTVKKTPTSALTKNLYKPLYKLTVSIIFFLIISTQLYAQKTWTAAGSGLWSVGANWSGGTAPGTTDNVVLSPGSAAVITMDGNYTIANLTVGNNNNATLTFSSTFTLTVNGNFSQTNGTINLGTGTLNVKGTFSKTSGTFNQNTGTLGFTGTGAQTISTNDATRTFYNLTVNNAAGLTIIAPATNLTISNTLTLTSGRLAIGSNTLTLNGTVASMSAANSLTGSAGSNLAIGGTGALGTLFFNATTPGTTDLINTFTLNRTSSGTVTLGNNFVTSGVATFTAGKMAINGNTYTINGTVASMSATGCITGSATSDLVIGGIGALGTLYFDAAVAGTSNQVNDLTINRTSSGTITLGSNLYTSGIATFTAGKMAIASNTLTINGTVASMSATGCITGSATSDLVIGGTGALGTIFFDAATAGTSNQINDLTINRTSSGTITLGSNLYTSGVATFTAGKMAINGNTYTINGTVASMSTTGCITGSATSDLVIGGTGTLGPLFFDAASAGTSNQINDLTINRTSSGTITLGSNLYTSGVVTFTAGKLVIASNTLTINGTVTSMSATGCLTGSSTSVLNIGGTGAMGTIWFDASTPGTTNLINSFVMNRTSSGIVTLGSDLYTSGTATFTAGKLGINGNTYTITGGVTSMSAAGCLTGSATSNLAITGTGPTGTVWFDAAAPGTSNLINNFTFNRTSSGTVILGSDLIISGTGTFTAGKMNINSKTLTINGTVASMSTTSCLTASSGSNLVIGGTGPLGTLFFDPSLVGITNILTNLTINRTSSGTVTLGNNLITTGAATFTAGKMFLNGTTYTINGTVASMSATGCISGSASSNLTIGGTGALGTLWFDATSPGTTNLINNLTINRTASGTITLGNDLVTGGTATFTAGKMAIGSTTYTINGTVASMSTTGCLTGSASSDLVIGGTGSMGTIFFDAATPGTSDQINDLTINRTSSGTVTLGSNLYTSGVATFTAGKLLLNGLTYTINGTVASMSATGCITGSSTSGLNIGGTGAMGTLYLDATTPGTTNQVNTSTINRSTSGTVTLGYDMNVRTTLTLTNGIITTGSNKVILPSTATLGRTNGYVNGNLQKNIATGATSKTFEIGDATNYTPATLAFASVTVAGDVYASTSTPLSSQPNIGTFDLSSTVAVNRYWNLTSVNTLAFTNYNGTFNFVAGDLIGGVGTGNLKGGVYSSAWAYPAMGALNATNSTINTVTTLGSVCLGSCIAPTAYNVTGGGGYCSGGSGTAVGLSNSQTGVSYQLQIGGVNTGSPVAGTGAAISFGNQTAAGTYTVIATKTSTSCTNNMTGSVAVSINPLPSLTLTGPSAVCAGATSLTLAYSAPVNSPDQYSLDWNAAANAAGMTDVGFTALSGGNITIGSLISTPGNYGLEIYVRNSTTGCQNTVTSGVMCSTVAENSTLSLSTPNGALFTAVNFASYGTPTGSCGSFATSSCHAATSLSVLQAAAIGTTSFSIGATNGVFGDPCVGTVKTLAVEAAYGFSITVSAPLTATITGTTTICNGGSTTLTVASAPSYAWSTGATTQSITVSPTTNTTYTVTTSNLGCNSFGSQLVTVNPLPSVTLTSSTPAVCAGVTTVAVNYTTPVNSPDQYSITWTSAGIAAGLTNVTNASLSGGLFNITGITSTAGIYPAIINIRNSATGCSSNIASGNMCGSAVENATLTMTAPGAARFVSLNFASYGTPTGSCGSYATSSCHAVNSSTLVLAAAYGNNSFSIGANNGIFGDPCNGTVKLLAVDANYSTFSLTVNAIPATPTAGSNSPVCSGNTINLTASAVAGATYNWTGPLSYTSTSQNPSITSATTGMSGTYSVTSSKSGCTSAAAGTVSVVVNAAPSATISYAGSPFCNSVTSGAVTFTGTTGGVFTAPAALSINSSTGTINPSTSIVGGPYTVTYTIAAAGGCSLFSTTANVTIYATPTAAAVSGAGTWCGSKLLSATGGTGGTMYFQGTTSGGTSTATASTAQIVSTSGTYYFRARNASGCWGTEGSATVTINAYPTFTSASLASTACAGGGATINMTGLIAGSTNNTVSYMINGVAQTPVTGVNANGSGNASFTTVALTAANNGQTLQITGISNSGCSLSLATNITLAVNAYRLWLGVNTDWNNTSNWCGGIPSTSTDVVIPTGLTYYPILTTGTHSVKNITIANGASVTVTGSKLQISATISNSGTFNASAGTLEFNGSSAQSVNGSWFSSKTLNSLIVSNTAGVNITGTSSDTLNIIDSVAFGNVNSTTLTTGDNLVLKSNLSKTARISDLTNNGSNSGNNITGKVTIERYVSAHKSWRLITAPVTSGSLLTISAAWQESSRSTNASVIVDPHPGYGTQITYGSPAYSGYDQGLTANISIKYLNSAGWLGYPSKTDGTTPGANNGIITDQPGYMVYIRGSRAVDLSLGTSATATTTTLRPKGQINTGQLTIPTTQGSGTCKVVGNPYPSAINFHKMKTNGSNATLPDAFYIWDPTITGVNGLGAWVSFSYNTGNGNYDQSVPTSLSNNGDIQSGTAFMINYSGSSIVIKERDKATGSASTQLIQQQPAGQLKTILLAVNAEDSSVSVNDGALVTFDAANSNNVDEDDMIKLSNFGENISISHDQQLMSIERRAPLAADDTVYLKISKMKAKSYKLQFDIHQLDVPQGTLAFLEDSYLMQQTPVNIEGTTMVDFKITDNPSAAADRFRLVFKAPVIVLPVTFTGIKAWKQNKDVAVQWKVENEINIVSYDVERSTDGHNYIKQNTTAARSGNSITYNWLDEHPLTGDNYYRVRSIGLDGERKYSEVAKVRITNGTASLAINPNPVQNGMLQLVFTDMPQGNYDLRILNNPGQVLMTKQIVHSGGSAIQTIPLGDKIAKGIYKLEILRPDQTKTTLGFIN